MQNNTMKKNLKNDIYLDLKDKLINCVYEPGSLLNEIQLATDYGLSRTPIREVLTRLEIDGYIKVIPKKGIYVTDISLNDVMQIFQTRLEIEPITLTMAAPHLDKNELYMFRRKFVEDDPNIANSFRIDTAMHLFIIENCGNNYLIQMMRKIFDDNTRVVIASKQNEVKIHDAKREHIEILDSLLNQCAIEVPAQLMKKHIETCRRTALDYFYSREYHNRNRNINTTYQDQLAKLDNTPR